MCLSTVLGSWAVVCLAYYMTMHQANQSPEESCQWSIANREVREKRLLTYQSESTTSHKYA